MIHDTLILEEVLRSAVQDSGEGVLFGLKQRVITPHHEYDFFFHYIPHVLPKTPIPSDLFATPVIHPLPLENAETNLAEYKRRHPQCSLVAVRDSQARPRRVRDEPVICRSLRFYDIHTTPLGVEVCLRPVLAITTNSELQTMFPKWEEVRISLDTKRKSLDNQYYATDL